MEKRKYYGIDWLRAFACVGIALMHIKANTDYRISGFLYEAFIPSLTHFVYLFMMISAFGMCIGYFDKVLAGTVNWTAFYRSRYKKILPFFAVLILIDVVMDFSMASVCEALTEVTLLFGFVPQELSVIGVGWYLGTVFVFYMIFPFFCVLIENKKRAWMSFAGSIVLHLICVHYYDLNRHNILFSLMFFIAGGLVYQYRKSIEAIKWYYFLPAVAAAIGLFYVTNNDYFAILLLAASLLVLAVSIPKGKNSVVSFISGISMEIYLSHMAIFRIVEKLHLTTKFGSGWVQYSITSLLVLIGAGLFSFCVQNGIHFCERKLGEMKK